MDQRPLDESERRKIQEELFQLEDLKDHAEERFQHLFENALVGLYRIRLEDGVILAVNNVAAELLGYSDSNTLIQEENLREGFWGKARGKFLKSLRKKGNIGSFRTRTHRVDGTVVWVELSAKAYPDSGYAEGIVKDITEQKQAEDIQREAHEELEKRVGERTAELEHANERLSNEIEERKQVEERMQLVSSAVEQSSEGITVADMEGDLLFTNNAFAAMHGYSPEELVGKPLSILHTPEQMPSVDAANRQIRETGNFSGEIWHVRRDGTVFPTQMHNSLLRDEMGNATGLIATARDITEHKRVEAALRQAKEDAEAANRAKSEFLANMSHELRTPLNGVIGMTSLLLATGLDGKQQRYAQTAKTSADTLLNLINDILDLSKIEAGKLELETIEFDLWTTVEDVIDTMAYKAAEKGLELTGFVAPSIEPHLRGDPGRLRQVLANLTSNAIKFTKRGEVVVQVIPVEETDRHVVVQFTIRDTGIGIPSNRMDQLFQSFSQVDTSTTRKYGGTGLGLRISQQLTELMGGEIGVESEVGKGSMFWFTARFQKLSRPTELARRWAMCDDLQGMRVLVVDDNATNREILWRQLTVWGGHVESAVDGPSALAMLREAATAGTPFRMAILDMQMPGMDGTQLGKAIKADHTLRDTVLLMLTSLGNESNRAQMETIGFAGYATKPIKQSELLNTILKAIANKDARKGRRVPEKEAVNQPFNPKQDRSDTRILLVEDNLINQEVAANILELKGYRFDVVSNGREAVEAIREARYDAILMDCQMPEMDGFEATRTIRQMEERGEITPGSSGRIPIIALTANALKGDREHCLAAGMDGYVSKPLGPETLIEAIEAQLPHLSASSGPVEDPPSSQALQSSADNNAPPSVADPGKPSPPFDVQDLARRCLGNLDVVERVIKKFERGADDTLEQIRRSVAAGDAGEITRLAHRLKGTAANLSAETLRVAATQLEETARAGDLSEADACLAQLRGELERCLKYVPELLTRVRQK